MTMRRPVLGPRFRRRLAAAVLALAAAFASAEDSGLFLDGRWEGFVELRGAAQGDRSSSPWAESLGRESLALRVFTRGQAAESPASLSTGGLVDMPSRGLFGYPMGAVSRDSEGMAFGLLGDAPVAAVFELRGAPMPVAPGESYSVAGRLSLVDPSSGKTLAEGSFELSYSGELERSGSHGSDFPIDTGRGLLPGSLLLPEGAGDEAVPAVLILSGAGGDRDGNNFAVPGKSDALADFARALRARGLASLRFDRRGSGEAYGLGPGEGELRFDDHVADARAALRALAADRRFSSVLVAGFSEGALVGALAITEESAAPGRPARGAAGPSVAGRLSGLAAICASGRSELEIVREALSSAPEELAPEAEAILSALEAGGTYPNPSPYFADYFRPSAQPYLASLYRRNIRDAVAAARAICPVLVAAGEADLQVGPEEAELLARAAPDIAYRVIPGMNHALKAVGEDEDANYASFTDPGIPFAEGLADLTAAFARGEGY
jgi:uncharacterized protein